MNDPVDESLKYKDEIASLNLIMFTGSLLALIIIGYRINTHQLRHVPESGAAMALGFALGMAVRALRLTEEEQLLNFNGEFFFYVLLPPIIFEAGLSLQTQMFIDNFGAIITFAVFGTLISTLVVSTMMRWAAELQLLGLHKTPSLSMHCHLFGALISATDPVATIALFGGTRFRADPLLHSLVNGESVLNDAVAIVLFSTLTNHMEDEEPRLISAPILGHFFLVSVGSLAIGLMAGALCSWCFSRSLFLTRFPDYEISGMCLSAYLTYAFSQLIGLSGIVALFFFGVVMAHYNWYNLSEPAKIASKVSFGTLSKLAETCVFVYLGLVAALSIGRFHWHFGLVSFSLIAITLARAAHIFPLSVLLNLGRNRKIDRNMRIMMWISGLRGAIAFALSLRIPCASGELRRRGSDHCHNSDLLVTTTISIVMLTTLVIGTAMEKVATALDVIEPLPNGYMNPQITQEDGSSLSIPLASTRGMGGRAEGSFNDCSTSGGSIVCPVVHVQFGSTQATDCNDTANSTDVHHTSEDSLPRYRENGARSLWSLRFNARGNLYQAFARFDLNVLQPILGGPNHARAGGSGTAASDTVELPSLNSFGGQPGLRHFQPPSEEDTPNCSRSVIFE